MDDVVDARPVPPEVEQRVCGPDIAVAGSTQGRSMGQWYTSGCLGHGDAVGGVGLSGLEAPYTGAERGEGGAMT